MHFILSLLTIMASTFNHSISFCFQIMKSCNSIITSVNLDMTSSLCLEISSMLLQASDKLIDFKIVLVVK